MFAEVRGRPEPLDRSLLSYRATSAEVVAALGRQGNQPTRPRRAA